MAPNAILNIFPPTTSKLVGKATDSVTDRSVFPPKPTKSVDNKATKSSGVSPEKFLMQLVFTEFGLSPVTKTPSSQFPISPAFPHTTSLSSSPFSKVELPRSHQQASMKTNNVLPKLRKQCRCKQSRCLKLYCECFADGGYCDGCGCNCCRNNVENEALRKAAMEHILERNANAFRPKIANISSGAQDDVDIPTAGKHNWGCRCKKTECLKNYCECFHAKVFCSRNCKCVNCKNSEQFIEKVALSGSDCNSTKICYNSEGYEKSMVVSGGNNCNTNVSKKFEGFEERKAFANGEHSKTNINKHVEGCQEEMAFSSWENYYRKICVKQANAVISTAVGLSSPSILQASKKRKLQEFLDSNDKDPPDHQKVNPFGVSSSFFALSVNPIDHVDSSAILGSSEFHCSSESLFTDIVQMRDVEELCSILVLVSEAARKFLGKNGTSDIQAVRRNQSAHITEVQDWENFKEGPNVQKETSDKQLSGNKAAAMNKDDFISAGIDLNEGWRSSPGTIELMSSEIDELFMEASKPSQIPIHRFNEDVYVEQERLVLTSFSDFLKKIILGNMKGQFQHVDNPIVKDGTAT